MNFPQPIRTKEPFVYDLWYTNEFGEVVNTHINWVLSKHNSDLYDKMILTGKYYSNRDDAELRKQYDELELAKVQIPLWIDITKEYEVKHTDGAWYNLKFDIRYYWNQLKPDMVRLKSKPVIIELNGVTYSWPATVDQAYDNIQLYEVDSKDLAVRYYFGGRFGSNIHHSQDGAYEQLRFFKALKAAMAGIK